jgi:hypothetical protein
MERLNMSRIKDYNLLGRQKTVSLIFGKEYAFLGPSGKHKHATPNTSVALSP